jgi:hypothetical protein
VNHIIVKVDFKGKDFFLKGSKIAIQGRSPQVT